MECEIKLLDLPEHKPIMSSGYQCVMHIHSALEEVYIKEILGKNGLEINIVAREFDNIFSMIIWFLKLTKSKFFWIATLFDKNKYIGGEQILKFIYKDISLHNNEKIRLPKNIFINIIALMAMANIYINKLIFFV